MRFALPKKQVLIALAMVPIVLGLVAAVCVAHLYKSARSHSFSGQLQSCTQQLATDVSQTAALNLTDSQQQAWQALAQALPAEFVVLGPQGECLFSAGTESNVPFVPIDVIRTKIASTEASQLAADQPEAAAAHGVAQAHISTFWSTEERKRLTVATVPVVQARQTKGWVQGRISMAPIDAESSRLGWWILATGMAAGLVWTAAGLVWHGSVDRQRRNLVGLLQQLAQGESRPLPLLEGRWEPLQSAIAKIAAQLSQRKALVAQQEHAQQAMLSSMVEGVLALDAEERVVSLNQAAEELLDLPPGGSIGKSLPELIRNSELRALVERAMATGEPVVGEVLLHSSGGRLLQAQGIALRDEHGNAGGAVVVMHDVTRLRRLENLRRDFVANVSHELKTPISSIKGFVETLLDGAMKVPADCDRFLRIILNHSNRLHAIVDDLLALSRIEQQAESDSIMLELSAVADVLEAVVHAYQDKAASRQIVLDLAAPKNLACRVNARLLEQAVANLVENAIKYSDPGKTVHIELIPAEAETVIVIRDQGFGIAQEYLDRIFERFYRVDKGRSRKEGGTGLGLAIVKHIANAHQGSVRVESALGQGSTFYLLLPGKPVWLGGVHSVADEQGRLPRESNAATGR